MLRDPSLIPLSHQHQHTLALCVRLDRALQAASFDLSPWQLELHSLYENEMKFHFAAEEKVLFPAARRFPELTALVDELIGEHEQFRKYFARADQGSEDRTEVRAELTAFADLLSSHIRKEERQLFEAMQVRMNPEELKFLGIEMTNALVDAVHMCQLGAKENEAERSSPPKSGAS